jgi:hypothetical protein
LIEKAYRWPVERAIGASIEPPASTNSGQIVLLPDDATRAGTTEYLTSWVWRPTDTSMRSVWSTRSASCLRTGSPLRAADAGATRRSARDPLPYGPRLRGREHAHRRRKASR